jgi:hypothetical protein
MTAVDTLRARFRPEWKTRPDLAGIETMLENALSFIAAPKVMKDRIAKVGTLNALGIAQAMRRELSKDVVPELRRIRRVVSERKEATKHERAALAKPTIDATDLAAALLRQEMRTYLRDLSLAERMNVLSNNPDPIMLVAALEAPAVLSGLTAETRAHVEEAYVQAKHAKTLRVMDDREEALTVVDVAAQFAVAEVFANVRLEAHEFDGWFATADGTEGRRAA